jgi:hypothetical protein
LDILTMHGTINFKSPNNISKWQMGFNSAFKGLMRRGTKVNRMYVTILHLLHLLLQLSA